MSNSVGKKTINGENTAIFDSLDIIGDGLAVDDNFGLANQFLGKDINNALAYKTFNLSDFFTAGSMIDISGAVVSVDLTEITYSDVGINFNSVITTEPEGQRASENIKAFLILDATATPKLQYVNLGDFITNQIENRPTGLHFTHLIHITNTTGNAFKAQGNIEIKSCVGNRIIYSKTSASDTTNLILGSDVNRIELENSLIISDDDEYDIGEIATRFKNIYSINFIGALTGNATTATLATTATSATNALACSGNSATATTATTAVNLSGFITGDIGSGTHNLGGTGEVFFDDGKFNKVLPKSGGLNKTIGLSTDIFSEGHISDIYTNHIRGTTSHGEFSLAVQIDNHLPSADNTEAIGDYNIRYKESFIQTSYTNIIDTIGSETHIELQCPLKPNLDNTNELGLIDKRFKNIFSKDFTGTLTGNATSSTLATTAISCSGNSATATLATTATNALACSGNSATATLATSATNALACSGNSATATLATTATTAGSCSGNSATSSTAQILESAFGFDINMDVYSLTPSSTTTSNNGDLGSATNKVKAVYAGAITATTFTGNLTGTVFPNADILPNANNTIDLGQKAIPWPDPGERPEHSFKSIYATDIYSSTLQRDLEIHNGSKLFPDTDNQCDLGKKNGVDSSLVDKRWKDICVMNAYIDGSFTMSSTEINFTNLHTSDPAVAGKLWRDGTDLKISVG